jgi:hypothetical protein
VKIQKLGVIITEIPGVKKIEVSADCITLHGFGSHSMPEEFGLPETRQLRDALTAAVQEAERMVEPTAEPVRLFTPDQILSGDEDLPIGTVVVDKTGDQWGLGDFGWGTDTPEPYFEGTTTLTSIVEHWAPVRIVSLP